MSVDANSLGTMLQVYAFKSIQAFAADLPPRDLCFENFDDAIGTQGQAVVTRIPTSQWGALNDLSNGWEHNTASVSNVTCTLKTLGHDHIFDITKWSTIGEQQLLNTFQNILVKQVANGITANVISNVSSSFYTNTVTAASSSTFAFTGANSLQTVATTLDNYEIPQAGRYCIINPVGYQSLMGSLYQQYVYGDPTIVRYNGYRNADGSVVNSSNPGLYAAGFNIFKYPRFGTLTAKLPYGGDKYTGKDILVGFAGNKAGIAVAARTPVPIAAPLAQSTVVQEPTSGWPLQFIMGWDFSQPGMRFGAYTLFGSAPANPYAIVPILATAST